jgi:alkylhydroperoxidase family enzyme
MSEIRIEMLPFEVSQTVAAEIGVSEPRAKLSIFRVALKSPLIAKSLGDLLDSLLKKGALDRRLRELILMRIGWATSCEYVWTQHWRIATNFEIPVEDILGVREWSQYEGFGNVERAVLGATDEILADGIIADETWAELRNLIDDDAVLFELVVTIGNWQLFSTIVRTLKIPLEEGVVGWPPNGESPR